MREKKKEIFLARGTSFLLDLSSVKPHFGLECRRVGYTGVGSISGAEYRRVGETGVGSWGEV